MTEPYEEFVAGAQEDSNEAHRAALETADPVALTPVGILDGDLPGARAAGWFKALAVTLGGRLDAFRALQQQSDESGGARN
ncbi:MAG: hypothetical protein ACRDHO_13945 [Actinomycetota bacterium]